MCVCVRGWRNAVCTCACVRARVHVCECWGHAVCAHVSIRSRPLPRGRSQQAPEAQPLPSCSFLRRSELIQLVAVTQKAAERSYREHIEQQIQTYQRR